LQTGVADGQSASALHATQVWVFAQNLLGLLAQSMSLRHSVHCENIVSQTGVAPEHCAFDVHPGTHVKVRGLQIGRAVPQSALLVQATHAPLAERHRGAVAGQSEFTAQATQLCVVSLQILSAPVQSAALLQPTHAPPGSQMGAPRGQFPPLPTPGPPVPPSSAHAA
jgi:hypothetical protein